MQQPARQALTDLLKALQIRKQILALPSLELQDLKALREQRKSEKLRPSESAERLALLNNESMLRNSELYNLDFLKAAHGKDPLSALGK